MFHEWLKQNTNSGQCQSSLAQPAKGAGGIGGIGRKWDNFKKKKAVGQLRVRITGSDLELVHGMSSCPNFCVLRRMYL